MVKNSTFVYVLDSRVTDKSASEIVDFEEFDDILNALGEPVEVDDKMLEPIMESITSLLAIKE